MRILSWNVNGIRAVYKKDFLPWLAAESPDILCVQETKAEPGQLPSELKNPLAKDGSVYHSFWASAKKRGYSGVAIFTKTEPHSVEYLGESEFDDEGRALIALYDEFALINAYFPNSQDGGARLPYKLDFCRTVLKKCKKLVKSGRHIVLCGDYNIAHKPIDLARPKENEGNAGYLPEERAWMDEWTSSGFVDTFRHFYPDKPEQYSWWSYRGGARERNVGWRLDYHCVDADFVSKIQDSTIQTGVTGSDHCPVELVIKSA
jgi:exodeoxyribonuclease-3